MYKKLFMIVFLFGCSGDKNPVTENVINTNNNPFALERITYSPDDIVTWATRGATLVVYLQTEIFSQNGSSDYFDVETSLHRGVFLYQLLGDTVAVIGTGTGKIVDGFNRVKKLIYPGEVYRHISRVDSSWLTQKGSSIFYFNFWYENDELPDIAKTINNITTPNTMKMMGKELVFEK